jgi:hypothetical protein
MIDAKLINYAYKGLRADYQNLHKRFEENSIVNNNEYKKRLDELKKGLSAYCKLLIELEFNHPTIFREVIFRHSLIRYLQNELTSLEEWVDDV